MKQGSRDDEGKDGEGMRRREGVRIAVVLVLSLILAGYYIDYGRRIQASATETEGESETESEPGSELESETESEPGSEAESEPGSESESELESESEIETESEPESEPESEIESELGSEPESEIESEAESEAESEPESEPESEIGSEPERESERECETESESERQSESEEIQPEAVYIENIRVEETKEGRVYDGTNQIRLLYDIRAEHGDGEKLRDQINCQASLDGSDVGRRQVCYEFSIPGELEGQYILEVEKAELEVEIKPQVLSVKLPDGWKAYGSKAAISQVYLLGEVEVSGFVKDKNGKEIVPEGFQPPQVKLDTSVVGRWSPIYENGVQKIYQNAIVLKYGKDGQVTGNPTANYCFETDPATGNYQRGSLTIVQSQIQEGVDYDVYGDEDSCHWAGEGFLWVRSGTGVHIVPRKDSGYNQGMDYGQVTGSGTLTFALKKLDGNGVLQADSLEGQVQVLVDDGVPPAEVQMGGTQEREGVYYGKPGVTATIRIPEDGKSGLKTARYLIAAQGEAAAGMLGQNGNWWIDCQDGELLTFTEDGAYQVYVQTEDYTGNRAYAKSAVVVVDSQEPYLTVEGVKNQSANGGALRITVKCEDPNYQDGSLRVEVQGAKGGGGPEVASMTEDENGAQVTFQDFPRSLSWDDRYELVAAARDLCGNEATIRLDFSVNRFGSVYDLAEETKTALAQFYHVVPFPVVFLETNLDYVGTARILCLRDGKPEVLTEGKDYTVELTGEGTWKEYRYTIPQNVFASDGAYEVILTSRDQASNSSDSQAQQKAVRFFIDSTPPECMITGVEADGIYQASQRWICLEARDNSGLETLIIYMDGVRAASYSGEQVSAKGGIIKWRIGAKDAWQRIQVYARDLAGNECWTEELPVYVTEADRIDGIMPYERTEKTARELEMEQTGKPSEDPEQSSETELAENEAETITDVQKGSDRFSDQPEEPGSWTRKAALGALAGGSAAAGGIGVCRMKRRKKG